MQNSPIPFFIFVGIISGLAYLIYRIGKKSTSCGVTLGLGLIVLFIIVAIVSTEITYQVQLTPVK